MPIVHHPLDPADGPVVDQIRVHAAATKGSFDRASFDTLMASLPAAPGVAFEPAAIAGIAGWWCKPPGARPNAVMLHLHGGGYVVGSAMTHKNSVSQYAAAARLDTFIPEYRLAPEHPFPAALDDALAVYRALATRPLVLSGDSAGGGLALALLGTAPSPLPKALLALSPLTDLSHSGASMQTRAAVDPYFLPAQIAANAGRYLAGAEPLDPRASPLYATLPAGVPIEVHVGDAEILLDDSTRLADRATVHVWDGMPHVFPANVDHLRGAARALERIGAFIEGTFSPARVASAG